MKLLRYGPPGFERPGLLDAGGQIRDLTQYLHGSDIAGTTLDPERLKVLARLDPTRLPLVPNPLRLGPCVGGVGKIVCVGLNYRSLATQAGLALPTAPVIFLKAASAICGPDDDLELPPGSAAVDWEVELAVVIGRTTRRVSRDQAMAHVAGYCIINDVSARDWQFGPDGLPGSAFNGGQWDLGKNHDGFAPLGPWLVTPDEIGDPDALALWLDVDDQRMQGAATSDWLFDLPTLIAHVSQHMTLHPGDLIATGTPPGCGFLRQPPRFLEVGEVLRAGIDRLGTQTRRVVATPED
ncbi:MAG TPA: fumarylacetoacetate hydrolase family protein [Rhodocyclaceae bacterium]|nr:fumarylacetoacetate hydrolase family protein [Rhodocyclaceae bacterium]